MPRSRMVSVGGMMMHKIARQAEAIDGVAILPEWKSPLGDLAPAGPTGAT